MTFFGSSSRYEQIDSPDAVEFRVISVLQGVHLLVGGVSAATAVAFLAPVWIGILAGAAVAGVWYLMKRDAATPRVLKVTSIALEAVGKGPSERVLWSDVMRLEYRNGGEDEPSGLAAKTGRWTWVWLVKDVDSAQAEAITDTVFRRFPLVTMAPQPPGLLENWFGRSETTRLNLNDQQK